MSDDEVSKNGVIFKESQKYYCLFLGNRLVTHPLRMKSQGKKIVEEANSSTADKDNDDNDNTKFLTMIAETEALRKQLAEKDRQLAEKR